MSSAGFIKDYLFELFAQKVTGSAQKVSSEPDLLGKALLPTVYLRFELR